MHNTNALEDEAKELQEYVTSGEGPLFKGLLISVPNSSIIFFRFSTLMHVPTIGNIQFLTRSRLNWVRVQRSREHVIEVGNCCECCITNNDKSIVVKGIQEENGHDFKDDSDAPLYETNTKSIDNTSILAIILIGFVTCIIVQGPSLKTLRMIYGKLHDLHSVPDLFR